jgi:3-hydroxyisobutyrate dehydrogenase-like beta-hydroxyacid dehydrogenase
MATTDQLTARRRATAARKSGLPVIAAPVPTTSWGGREQGWTTYLLVGTTLHPWSL